MKGAPGDRCWTSEDCEEGLVCIFGICQHFLEECSDGRQTCGDVCCPSSQHCVEEVCVCADGRQSCGDDCCAPYEDCVGGVCRTRCPSDHWCGQEPICCAEFDICQGGRCCPSCGGECCDCPDCMCRDNQCRSTLYIPCGDTQCRWIDKCIDGACCPPELTCEMKCCEADEVCEAQSCHRDCGGRTRCGEAEDCCEAKQLCYLGACTLPGADCGDPLECPAGQFCDLDLGLCLPQGESEGCGSETPDLVPMDFMVSGSLCPSLIHLSARVLNRGDVPVPAGVPSSFYQDFPEVVLVATALTTRELAPGESQELAADCLVEEGSERWVRVLRFVVDDDGTGAGAVAECREDNNASGQIRTSCETP